MSEISSGFYSKAMCARKFIHGACFADFAPLLWLACFGCLSVFRRLPSSRFTHWTRGKASPALLSMLRASAPSSHWSASSEEIL